jgi:hypothetical protein
VTQFLFVCQYALEASKMSNPFEIWALIVKAWVILRNLPSVPVQFRYGSKSHLQGAHETYLIKRMP